MSNHLVGVILAGQFDWGACPLTRAVPRPLAPVANRPIIAYAMRAFDWGGVDQVALCTNLDPSFDATLKSAHRDDFDLEVMRDAMPRGPAGCIRDAAASMGRYECDVLVCEAATIPHFDLTHMIEAHRATGAALTVAVQSQGPSAGAEASRRTVGVYLFSKPALDLVSECGFVDIKEDLIPRLHKNGKRINVHVIQGAAPRLTGIGGYFSINEWAVHRAVAGSWDSEGYVPDGQALVHADAVIEPGAKLVGPVMVGPCAVVRQQAIVVGPTTIDRNAVIGFRTVVCRSAVWAGARIGADAYVDRSVIAAHARVSAKDQMYRSVCVGPDQPPARRRAPGASRATRNLAPEQAPVDARRS